jgi:hypothetical protein
MKSGFRRCSRLSSSFALAVRALIAAAALPLLASCGAEQSAANAPKGAAIDLDGDAIALLPPGAVVAVSLDVHALYADHAFGAQIGALAESVLPLGPDTGFVPSRDLEQATLASYALQGADAVAVLRGHFDAAAIERAAQAHAASHAGVVATTPYSGHTMYTVANIGFAVLTPRTILAGTGAGLRLALDRIRDGRVRPELPVAMMETLRTKDAVATFAGDFTATSLAGLQGLPIPPWVGLVKGVRAAATLHEPGVNVAGSVTFDSPEHASAGGDAMRQLSTLVNTMAVTGVVPRLINLSIATEAANVQVSFGMEDAAIRSLLQHLPQWLPSKS